MTTKVEIAMPIQSNQLYVNGEWRDAADGATLDQGIMKFLETQYVSIAS